MRKKYMQLHSKLIFHDLEISRNSSTRLHLFNNSRPEEESKTFTIEIEPAIAFPKAVYIPVQDTGSDRIIKSGPLYQSEGTYKALEMKCILESMQYKKNIDLDAIKDQVIVIDIRDTLQINTSEETRIYKFNSIQPIEFNSQTIITMEFI